MPEVPPLTLQDIVAPLFRKNMAPVLRDIKAAADQPGAHRAILGPAYSGRDLFLRQLAEEYPSTAAVHTFTSPVTDLEAELEPYHGAKLLFLNNAHYLAVRKIGGFGQLEAFRSFLATTETSVISAWNTTAWNYYSAIADLETLHQEVVTIPPVSADGLRDAIRLHYEGKINFVNDATIRQSFFASPVTHTITIPFTSRNISVPWLSLDLTLLVSAVARKEREETPENAVLFHLDRVSQGNAGGAAALWNSGLEYPEIRISHIREPPAVGDLSIDECNTLISILMLESVGRDDLAAIRGEDVDTILYRLKSRNLIEVTRSNLRIRPVMANSVLAHLTGIRMVS